MKRLLTSVLVLFYFFAPPLALSPDDRGWSMAVNGMQARLSFVRNKGINGTPFIVTYLELRNVSNIANVMEVPLKLDAIQFEVIDEQDTHVAPASIPFDGLSVELGMIRLPFDSCLRFNISSHGMGAPKDQGAILDLGPTNGWVFRRDDKRSYYLRARFTVEKTKTRLWSGTIEIPKIKIPTQE